jgi:hypothetical protein
MGPLMNVWMSGALVCALVMCATVTWLVCPREEDLNHILVGVGRLADWAGRQRVAAGHLRPSQVRHSCC